MRIKEEIQKKERRKEKEREINKNVGRIMKE